MANLKINLDSNGIAQVLKSPAVAAAVRQKAEATASNASHTTRKGETLPVRVTSYTTDRAASAVTIAHAAGLATEAKHGTLKRAARRAGLEIGRRSK